MTLVGSLISAFLFGVEVEETTPLGINVQSFNASSKPEFEAWVMNKTGEKIGCAKGATETTYTVSGQVSVVATTIALTFVAAISLANDKDQFGQSAGIILLSEATISQEQGTFRTFSATFTRNSLITAAS